MNDFADLQGETQEKETTICNLYLTGELEGVRDDIRYWAIHHPRVIELRINAGNNIRVSLKTKGGRYCEKTFSVESFKGGPVGCLDKVINRNPIMEIYQWVSGKTLNIGGK